MVSSGKKISNSGSRSLMHRPDIKIRRKFGRMFKYFFLIPFVGLIVIITSHIQNQYDSQNEESSVPKLKLIAEISKWKAKNRKSNEKIDWHDYDHIRKDKERKGPGEQGVADNSSTIPKKLVDKLFAENGYNGALSDIISLHRAIRDSRPKKCQKILYKKYLPTASVVITFYNEHFSTILRCLWSLVSRSPDILLKEIILVDDGSTKKSIREELEDYLKKFLPKVKLVRTGKRVGLMAGRIKGAKVSKGEVLIFLDAHCEANVNWLPPLLDIIADDYKTCVCPLIDTIHSDTFEYIADNAGGRGLFDWNLVYQVLSTFPQYNRTSALPYENPVMAGGLFAISSKYFWELGAYDEGLKIWGGEQYEISFKIWQCGGRILDVPCSRVGHIYRKYTVFENPEDGGDFLCINFRRVLEVWMDDYKQHYYKRHPDCAKKPYGDISKQLAIREKFNCKPFKWFMEEIAYDLIVKFPPIEPPNVARGQMRNVEYPYMCLEISSGKFRLGVCATEDPWWQDLVLTWRGEIKLDLWNDCVDSRKDSNGTKAILTGCYHWGGSQMWTYNEESKTIRQGYSNDCMEMMVGSPHIYMKPCKKDEKLQQWTLPNFNKTAQGLVEGYTKEIVVNEKVRRSS